MIMMGHLAVQAWKIRNLCKAVGRNADELIPTLKTVKEASGIIDQLMAEDAEKKRAAGGAA